MFSLLLNSLFCSLRLRVFFLFPLFREHHMGLIWEKCLFHCFPGPSCVTVIVEELNNAFGVSPSRLFIREFLGKRVMFLHLEFHFGFERRELKVEKGVINGRKSFPSRSELSLTIASIL